MLSTSLSSFFFLTGTKRCLICLFCLSSKWNRLLFMRYWQGVTYILNNEGSNRIMILAKYHFLDALFLFLFSLNLVKIELKINKRINFFFFFCFLIIQSNCFISGLMSSIVSVHCFLKSNISIEVLDCRSIYSCLWHNKWWISTY